jgi:hypothetical protein
LGLYAGLSLLGVLVLGMEPQRSVFTAASASYLVAGLASAILFHFLLTRPNRKDLAEAPAEHRPAAVTGRRG